MAHTVTIVGLGKVGTAWLNILPEAGYHIVSAYSRRPVSDVLKKKHPRTTFTNELPDANEKFGRFIFITVSDDAIETVSSNLAKIFSEWENKFVLHCSGVLQSNILSELKSKGAKTASFHPIKAVTKENDTFQGTWFDMEGDEELLTELELLCQKLEAHSFRVKPEAKPYLHASAVVASNYLVVLADLLTKIAAKGDVSEEIAMKALTPLMRNTLDNVEDLGAVEALTGPIARGDVKTIKNHLHSLNNDQDLLSLYKILGIAAVEIAQKKSDNSEALIRIKQLLS